MPRRRRPQDMPTNAREGPLGLRASCSRPFCQKGELGFVKLASFNFSKAAASNAVACVFPVRGEMTPWELTTIVFGLAPPIMWIRDARVIHEDIELATVRLDARRHRR